LSESRYPLFGITRQAARATHFEATQWPGASPAIFVYADDANTGGQARHGNELGGRATIAAAVPTELGLIRIDADRPCLTLART
jgi:hypothetical protein